MACGYFLGVSAGKREIVKNDVLRNEYPCVQWWRGAGDKYFDNFGVPFGALEGAWKFFGNCLL